MQSSPAIDLIRCDWARNDFAIAYHDHEWGVPCHDDRVLFEFLVLEGAQAGLSWDTILKKRESYRAAFEGFDPQSFETFIRGEKRESVYRSAEGIWIVRPLRVAFCWRQTAD